MTADPAKLQPVEDGTLRAQIARQLHAMVTGGHFSPGERLTEQALAAQLGVSRAPLREAVRELVDSGILISQPYRGLFVRAVSRTDLQEIYSMRTALEQFAFKLAWKRRRPEALADLQARYDAIVAAQSGGDQAAAIDCETNFHSWVYELSGHSLLMSHWRRLVPLVQIYLSLHHRRHGAHGEFRNMTLEYLEVASGRSLERMLKHIEAHMKQGLEAVLEAVPDDWPRGS